jgi:hypothetical protein
VLGSSANEWFVLGWDFGAWDVPWKRAKTVAGKEKRGIDFSSTKDDFARINSDLDAWLHLKQHQRSKTVWVLKKNY